MFKNLRVINFHVKNLCLRVEKPRRESCSIRGHHIRIQKQMESSSWRSLLSDREREPYNEADRYVLGRRKERSCRSFSLMTFSTSLFAKAMV